VNMTIFWKRSSLRVRDSEILVLTTGEKYLYREFISSHLVKTAKEFLYKVQIFDIISLKFVKTFFVTHTVCFLKINTSTNVCT